MWVTVLASALGALPLTYQSSLGFRLTLPEGFAPSAELGRGRTAAAAPAPPNVPVVLDGFFTNGSGPGASSLMLAVVDAPMVLDNGSPERVAAQVIAYLHGQLGADLHIEWVERVPTGAGEGMEIAARIQLQDEERVAQFAFVPFGDREIVLTVSLPASRFAVLGPAIERSLATLAFDRSAPGNANRRAAIGAAVGGLVGLLVVAGRFLVHRPRLS